MRILEIHYKASTICAIHKNGFSIFNNIVRGKSKSQNMSHTCGAAVMLVTIDKWNESERAREFVV